MIFLNVVFAWRFLNTDLVRHKNKVDCAVTSMIQYACSTATRWLSHSHSCGRTTETDSHFNLNLYTHLLENCGVCNCLHYIVIDLSL